MDRRIPFFAVMTLVCVGLAEVAGSDFRTVALVVAGVYAALTLAYAVDDLVGARHAERSVRRRTRESARGGH